MKDDKKKLTIVGVLVCIVVGIGAFEFVGGGSKSAPTTPLVAKKPATPDPKDPAVIKNPEFAGKLPEHNPFQAPDGVATTTAPPPQKTPQPPRVSGNISPERLPGAGPMGTIAPITVADAPPLLNYRLSGLILGRHPAAVFTDTSDKSGAQRLVPIGGSLDGDTQLVAVSKGRAVVSFRGKHLRLTLGGTPDAN